MDAKQFDLFDPRDRSDETTVIEPFGAALSARRIAEMLRSGSMPADHAFDRFLRRELRSVSRVHWTPVVAAARAAAWFDAHGARTVVDVGSGAGKFCVVAALACDATFLGIEQRPHLVAAARELARVFDVEDRARFVGGAFGVDPTPVADAYYFYNPFGENVFGEHDHLDEDVELGTDRFVRDVRHAERLLESAPPGTLLVTYNGFGGSIPAGYDAVDVVRTLPALLRLWRKRDVEATAHRRAANA